MTHDLWASLNSKILEYLSGVSLSDLVASQQQGKKLVMESHPCTLQPKIASIAA
jgi:Rrf2 family iron-sulfur cluster assembly transcriptional regulator